MTETPYVSEPDHSTKGSSSWKITFILGTIAVVLVAAVTLLVVFLMRNPGLTRILLDLMIITLALEILVIGFALIIVTVQLARLLHLLRHEIKPILDQASDTIGTLQGIARLVGDNVATPVIKLSGTLAGGLRVLKMLWPEQGQGKHQQ